MILFRIDDEKELARFWLDPHKREEAGVPTAAFSPDGRLLAAALKGSPQVRLIDVATAEARAMFTGHRDGVHALAFSPDGRTLATGGIDNVLHLWDVLGDAPPETWWASLASKHAEAVGGTVRAKGVSFLAKRLRPLAKPDPKEVARHIATLDADDFDERQVASRSLEALGETVGPALRAARKMARDIEQIQRLDALLKKLDALPPSILRALRGVEALEHIGTPEARRVLENLAKGAPGARATEEAAAALRRVR